MPGAVLQTGSGRWMGWLFFRLLLRVQCWVSLISGWGVPSAAVSPVARRDREDKWNGRAFLALVQATVARWFWFPDRACLFLWLAEGTMKIDDTAKCFRASVQAPVPSLLQYKVLHYLWKRRKVLMRVKFLCIKEDMRVRFFANIIFSICRDMFACHQLPRNGLRMLSVT